MNFEFVNSCRKFFTSINIRQSKVAIAYTIFHCYRSHTARDNLYSVDAAAIKGTKCMPARFNNTDFKLIYMYNFIKILNYNYILRLNYHLSSYFVPVWDYIVFFSCVFLLGRCCWVICFFFNYGSR